MQKGPEEALPTKCVNEHKATGGDQFRTTLQEVKASLWQRLRSSLQLENGSHRFETGDLIVVKTDAYQGKRKIKVRPQKVVCQIMTDVSSYKVKYQHGNSCILHHNWCLLIVSKAGIPLHVGVHQAQDVCFSSTPVKPSPRVSDSKIMPQEDDVLAATQSD